jgi:hypothetical protein
MNKFVFLLIGICVLGLSYSQNNLKFLYNPYVDYPVKFIEGFLDSFNGNKTDVKQSFPLIKQCLDTDDYIEDSFFDLIKTVEEFKGDERTVKNLFFILVKFGNLSLKVKSKYDQCIKDTKPESKFLINKFEEFLMNFPANFRVYYQNFNSNKNQIYSIINLIRGEIKSDAYKFGNNVGTIINIIIKNADYEDSGLESFEEFQIFNDCYSNILAGVTEDLTSSKLIIEAIYKKENLEDLFYHIANFFEILSNQIEYCNNFYNHLVTDKVSVK